MKIFSILLFTLITFQSFSLIKQPSDMNWRIKQQDYDSTLAVGTTKIRFIINTNNYPTPISNVKIHIDTNTYLGKTNRLGELVSVISSGNHRICADTPKGNSFVENFDFKDQYVYTLSISMFNDPNVSQKKPHAVRKPVIYLYPTETTKINIEVKPKGKFTFTYPKYPKNGWQVTAKPNGDITHNDRLYSYLFWEGESAIINEIDQNSGFIVNADTVVQFLENTLTTVGLTTKEQADFITFWAPILEQNKLNFIHFEFNDGYDKYISNMEITPKPDTEIRIFMTFKAVNTTYNSVTPQIIPTYKRNGFTVVEWGGSESN